MEILFILIKFAFIPLFIVSLYSIYVYRKLPNELRIFSWYIFFSAGIELVSRIWWFLSMNNMPFLHLSVAVGFCILAKFYKELWHEFINPKIIWAIVAGFVLLTTINSLFIQNIFTFNSYALSLESILIIFFSLYTLININKDIVKGGKNQLARSLNWINAGLFIFYSSSLLIFYFSETIAHLFSKEISLSLWGIHSFFSIIMYFCFFIGLWKSPKY